MIKVFKMMHDIDKVNLGKFFCNRENELKHTTFSLLFFVESLAILVGRPNQFFPSYFWPIETNMLLKSIASY